MKKFLIAVLLTVCASTTAFARGAFFGYVQKGGNSSVTGNSQSSTKVQQSYPGARVSVYVNGTTTLAVLFSDSIGTAKANPFTAGTDGSLSFWTDSTTVDLVFDQKGITTQCGPSFPGYPCISAFTWSAIPIQSVSSVATGIVCDGITDNTAAYAATVAALPTTGGTIQLPSGVCIGSIIMPGVTLPTSNAKIVRLLGAGVGVTIMQPAAANTPIITFAATSERAEIGYLSIKSHASGSTGAAIDLTNTHDTWIHDIGYLSNTGTFAQGFKFFADSTACYNIKIDRFRDVSQVGPTTVFAFVGDGASFASNANSVFIRQSFIYANSSITTVVDALRSTSVVVEQNLIEQNAGATAIKLGSHTTSRANWLESNAAPYAFGSGADGVSGYCTIDQDIINGGATITVPTTAPDIMFNSTNNNALTINGPRITPNYTFSKFVSSSAVGNGADATNDPLWTLPLIPPGSFAQNGDQLVVTLDIGTGATGTAKGWGITVGGTQINTPTPTENAKGGRLTFEITRIGATSVNVWFSGIVGSTVLAGASTNVAVADLTSSTLAIVITGNSGTSTPLDANLWAGNASFRR